MAIVDSFEAMTATQYYREPKSWDDAVFEIERLSGKRYDPKIVEAFKKALPAMQKVHETFADQLGDMINLDFAPKGAATPARPAAAAAAAPPPKPAPPMPAAPKKPAVDVAALARAAAAKAKK